MLELFIIKALIIGSLLGISTGILGNFLVASRQSMMSDMIAHTSLFGVGVGVFIGLSPVVFGILIGIASALVLFYLSFKKKSPADAIAVMILTTGLALAILLSHMSSLNGFNLENYLFGSILTITNSEAYIIGGLCLLISLSMWIVRKKLFKAIVDRNFMISQNQKALHYELFFLICVGVLISSSLKVIGGLLISALLVIPVLTSYNFNKRFQDGLILASLINVCCVCIGLAASYYFDVPTSSSIVLSLSSLYLLSLIFNKILKKI